MVAESGDFSLRLGQIGEPLENLRKNKVVQDLMDASRTDSISGCRECPYKPYCGPDPISSYAQYGQFDVPVHLTEHCQRHKRLFESFFRRLYEADEKFIDLAHLWAKPWQRSAHA